MVSAERWFEAMVSREPSSVQSAEPVVILAASSQTFDGVAVRLREADLRIHAAAGRDAERKPVGVRRP